jgi:hypothetical protein
MRVASLVQLIATFLCATPLTYASSTTETSPAPAASTNLAAPAQRPSPCADGPYREFDFWAGEWIVKVASGEEAGRNSVKVEQGGCVLIERWSAADGGTGISLNFYDPVKRVWTQTWVSPGTVLTMTGGLVNGEMVLEGPLHYLQKGRATRLKGTWTRLPDGRIRQHFVESADEGKTWTEWFDGYYSPI